MMARKTDNPLDGLMVALKQNAQREVSQQLQRALPPALRVAPGQSRSANPADDGEDDDDGDAAASDAITTTADGSLFAFFRYPDPARNLAAAAAAYRAAGASPEYDHEGDVIQEGDLIAQHTDGTAFFGSVEQLRTYAKRTDTRPEDWEVWDESHEILGLDYDTDAVIRMVRLMDEQEDSFKVAQAEYEKFHWGDKSAGIGIVEIPGVTGPLTALGIARRIEYGAQKQAGWEEYYHVHGEESGTYPTIYGVGPRDDKGHFRAYIVHGGQMRIEDRGIVD